MTDKITVADIRLSKMLSTIEAPVRELLDSLITDCRPSELRQIALTAAEAVMFRRVAALDQRGATLDELDAEPYSDAIGLALSKPISRDADLYLVHRIRSAAAVEVEGMTNRDADPFSPEELAEVALMKAREVEAGLILDRMTAAMEPEAEARITANIEGQAADAKADTERFFVAVIHNNRSTDLIHNADDSPVTYATRTAAETAASGFTASEGRLFRALSQGELPPDLAATYLPQSQIPFELSAGWDGHLSPAELLDVMEQRHAAEREALASRHEAETAYMGNHLDKIMGLTADPQHQPHGTGLISDFVSPETRESVTAELPIRTRDRDGRDL